MELAGFDVKRVSEQETGLIRSLCLSHKVVAIRNQRLSTQELCEFSAKFGTLMQFPYITPMEHYPQVIQVLKEADEINMGVFGGEWHSDFSFLETPPSWSILYAEEIPETGGDTLWANMSMAFDRLPDALKEELKTTRCIHTGAPYGVKHAPEESTQLKGSIEMQRNNPEADRKTYHPLVSKHPTRVTCVCSSTPPTPPESRARMITKPPVC